MWGFVVRLKGSGLALRIGAGICSLCRLGTGFRRLCVVLSRLGVALRRLGFGLGLRIRVSLGLDLRFSLGPLHRIARFRHVLSLDLGLFDFTASRLDRSPRTLRGANTLQRHSLLKIT